MSKKRGIDLSADNKSSDVVQRRSSRAKKQTTRYDPETDENPERQEQKRQKYEQIATVHCETISSDKMPKRNTNQEFIFSDYPTFRPNLSPAEVLHGGSFGGTYFRPIYSSITKKKYTDEMWKELPSEWLEGLNVSRMVASPTYRDAVNKYKVCWGII